MTEQRKMMLARFILSRLLSLACPGISMLWIDFASGRALVKFSPTDEQADEILKSIPLAGVA